MSLRLRSSGGGSITLQEPVTSIDSTINLPSANATFLASPLASAALTTPAVTGAVEYDGKVLYATPQGTQRGVVPGMQYFRLNSDLAGTNATGAQNIFGVGCTLSSSTVYAFEALVALSKSAGTTSHTHSMGFGGTATINNIVYEVVVGPTSATSFTTVDATYYTLIQTASQTVVQSAVAQATTVRAWHIKGTVSVNVGGTFIPQYSLSAAPGGAYTTAAGSYFSIWPIGTSGANVNVGTWA